MSCFALSVKALLLFISLFSYLFLYFLLPLCLLHGVSEPERPSRPSMCYLPSLSVQLSVDRLSFAFLFFFRRETGIWGEWTGASLLSLLFVGCL